MFILTSKLKRVFALLSDVSENMDGQQMTDFNFPRQKKINIMVLIYAVLEELTVDQAFDFLVYNKKTVEAGRKRTDIKIDEIRNMRKEGLTYEKIATYYNCCPQTIFRRIKKHGL